MRYVRCCLLACAFCMPYAVCCMLSVDVCVVFDMLWLSCAMRVVCDMTRVYLCTVVVFWFVC